MRYFLLAVLTAVLMGLSAVAGGHYAKSSLFTQARVPSFVHNGKWFADATLASPDSSARTRAYLAVVGLLGLPKEETIYFTLVETEGGEPLSSTGIYEVTGIDPPARWWSLTLYNADNFLTPNAYDKYSVRGTEMAREADGSFRIRLAAAPQEGNWIPMGEGENMVLLLRLYNPDPALHEQLATVELPAVRKIGEAQ